MQTPATVKVYDKNGEYAVINESDVPAWRQKGWTPTSPAPKGKPEGGKPEDK